MGSIVVKLPLATVLHEMEYFLKLEDNSIYFRSSKRVSVVYLDELLKIPSVFYVPLQSISANIGLKKFEQVVPYLSIVHHIPTIDALQFIYFTFSKQDIADKEIECIFVEAKKGIAKTHFLYDLIKIDSLLVKNTSNFTGKIDYEKLEKEFHTAYTKATYKKLVKKPGKYFFQNLLGLNLHHKRKDSNAK
ncbi:hypothetical protein MLC35_00935 [Sulfurimonas sp. NW7]|uniref:hypothetical protein n=1 Tax=Sulfurimonas sp. NW7 TaxID=2922727 RepID=UPI003DA8BBBD